MIWLVDGNNVFGSRPDGWWNDRQGAATRFAQRVAEWCRTHDDTVTVVFDAPVADETLELGGGNLQIRASSRRGRDAADHDLVALAADHEPTTVIVVTSDRGLRDRLDPRVTVMGVGRFRDLIAF